MDEFYLHQPDTSASLEETLEACHNLVAKGLIGALGMSNYHAIEVLWAPWKRPAACCANTSTSDSKRAEADLLSVASVLESNIL